jgi:outer membrane protein assembly factor BamB
MKRALILCLLSAAPVAADDWPQYLGPQRDGVWRESGILDKFPTGGPKVAWRAKVGAGYSGPAVADGAVYVADRVLAPGAKNHSETLFPQRPGKSIPGSERVLCFEQTTGKELWKHEYDCPYTISGSGLLQC